MSPLARPHAEGDWSDEILAAAREMFNGEISVIKPGTPGEWSAKTNLRTGGTPDAVILGPRAARAQHLSTPTESNDGNGWETRRRYRFQFEILDGDPSLTRGLVVKFTGGRDPELAKITFQILTATNSSHAALRTLECISELARA